MVTVPVRMIAWMCLAVSGAAFGAPADSAAPVLPLCVRAAALHLEPFGFAPSTLRSQCECVQQRMGALPVAPADWTPTSAGSPALTLLACAQADMEKFGYELFMETDGQRMRERLVPEQRIERLAQCVGQSFYEGPLRAVSEKLDDLAIRQDFQSRYDRCFQL